MDAPLQMVEPVGSGLTGGGRRGSRSGSRTSLERTGKTTPERMSNEPDDPDEDNQWMPDHDPRDERGEFASRAQFLLTVIGYTLGNGNFWYFPLVVRRSGGGTFLIIYCLCMAIFGVPMLYLEMMIGQVTQIGPMRAFQIYAPLLQGVGWAVCSLSFLQAINFSLVNAFSLEYAVESLIGVEGRTLCSNDFNTAACFSPKTNDRKCHNTTMVWFNRTCITLEERLRIQPQIEIPARQHFRYILRGLPPDFDEGITRGSEQEWAFGSGRVVVCFCIFWMFAAICLLRRVRWLGKLSLFIVTFSGILTIFFLFFGLFLHRSEAGMAKYFHIDWAMFKEYKVWQDGIRFTRTSLSLGLGGMISLSSYSKRSHDSFWDSVLVVAVVAGFSLSSGLLAFIILSNVRDKFPFMNWARLERYLTCYMLYFIYYPEAIGPLPFNVLWSSLFYAMLLTLGLSSFFGLLETPISALTDQFKWCRKHRSLTIIGVGFVGFAAGLIQCTKIGYHIFYILDVRIIHLIGMTLVGFQLLAVFLYGPRNFYRDINASMGKKVNFFGYFLSPYGLIIRICQFVVGPVLIAIAIWDSPGTIFKDAKKRKEYTLKDNELPKYLAYITFYQYPVIAAGVIAALVKHVKAGKPWLDLFRPDPMHPAIRYKVPPPLGCIFGLKPIEAMPSAMGDEKVIDFPDKKEPLKFEEEVLEIGRA